MTEIIKTEDDAVVEPGDIVTIKESRFRVLEMDEQTSILIEMDTNKTIIGRFNTSTLMGSAASGEYKVEKYSEPDTVVEKNNKKYMVRNALITDIKEQYKDDIPGFLEHHTSNSAKKLMEKHGIKSLATLLYIVRRYAQGGYSDACLMPEKHKYPKGCDFNIKNPKQDRHGRKAYIIKASDIPKMNDAIFQYKNQKMSVTTLHLAYKYLESKYYVEHIKDPTTGKSHPQNKKYGQKPSERQFINYFYSVYPVMERKKIKNSSVKIRNDNRLLPGGKLEEASHPGALLEIDACEVRVDLIGTYRPEYSVGKPTLYVMKDVYSKLIVAMSIGFGKNKTEALCKLFANMVSDKVKFCERYGIYGLKPEMWPSSILPQKVHCDRGPEFKAKEYHRICEALKIGKGLVPGATGSMKGDVEQFFHQLQSELDHFLKDHGLILKEYGCKHKTEAVLNMLDIAKMCILYVIYYNNRVMKTESFRPSIDMEEAKIRLSPVGVWNFGVETLGAPRPIQNKVQYLDTLRVPEKAKVTKAGIHFRDLIFYPNDEKEQQEHPDEVRELVEKMFIAQRTKDDIQILYDPNTIEYVKYISESGKTIKVPLNKGYRQYTKLEGYTFAMWKEYSKNQKSRQQKQIEEDSDMETGMIETMKNIVTDAVAANPTKPSAKNMKANRKYEENMDAPRESITAIQEEIEEQENIEARATPELSSPPELLTQAEATQNGSKEKKEENQSEESIFDDYDPAQHMKDLLRLM